MIKYTRVEKEKEFKMHLNKNLHRMLATLLLPVLTIMALFALAATALAQAASMPVSTGQGTAELLLALLSSVQSGQYLLGAAIAVAILTRAFNFLVDKVKPDWLPRAALPWISCGISITSMVIAALLEGKTIWQALILGVVTGATASGLYSLLLKHLPLIGIKHV